ncbi:FimV/HubP family polar landmark protein [Vibrio sp. MA40-2]|uniref:FimV/HubP family polar landmark protein n=1 Tax=Vibrio sp. MA40-2 TaxID=3391828 RepID=UPI0039A66D2D
MHPILKRLVTPLALLLTVSSHFVVAESIRIIGPNGEVQPSIPLSEQAVSNTSLAQSLSPANNADLYGPTVENETLWSIASQLRPSNQLSVQQTVLAIYKLNPQAFDQQNIHELIPGSELKVPSAEQIQAESTDEAIRIMQAHENALVQVPETSNKVVPVPEPIEVAQQTADVSEPTTEISDTTLSQPSLGQGDNSQQNAVMGPDANVDKLKQDLTASESELAALEEKNHNLRLMLTDVQTEVGSLKDELGDEARIRDEVEKLLEEERLKALQAAEIEPSQLDMLLANTWFVVLLALIPGLLFVLIIVLILTRKGSPAEVQETTELQSPQVISLVDDDDDVPEINLDEDIDEDVAIDDDLFGELSDDNIFDVEGESEPSAEDDIFANLDDSDLDFNLDDGETDPFADISEDGDFDTELEELELEDSELENIEQSANGISVAGDEKALSLADMERALDDEAEEPEDELDSEFDLSDESGMSQDDLDELLAGDVNESADLESDELEQSVLDDLFNSVKEESVAAIENDPSLDDFDLSDDDDDQQGKESDVDDIDDLLAEFQSASVSDSEEIDSESVDDLIAQNSTELLDDLVIDQSDDDNNEPELAQDSTELLDDFLQSQQPEQVDTDDTPVLAENSTELLDELFESSSDSAIADSIGEDSTDLLDEFLADDELSDDIEIDENSTALLDELLQDNGQGSSDDASVEDVSQEQDSDVELNPEFDSNSDVDTSLEVDSGLEAVSSLDADSSLEANSSVARDGTDSAIETDRTDEPDSTDQTDSITELDNADEAVTLDEAKSSSETENDENEQLTDEVSAQDDGFDFSPHIDGSEHAEKIQQIENVDRYLSELEASDTSQIEPVNQQVDSSTDLSAQQSEQSEQTLPEELASGANEFGTPQDADWDLEPESEPETTAELESALDLESKLQPVAESLFDDLEPIELDDDELGEYDENSALADSLEAATNEGSVQPDLDPESDFDTLEPIDLNDDELGEYDENSALADSFGQSDLDESAALAELLNEDDSGTIIAEQPLDDQTIDSAGLDIEAMLDVGEDWNGFELSPEQQAEIAAEVPEDELDIWETQIEEPIVDEEDWSEQSEAITTPIDAKKQFMSVDELMSQADTADDNEIDPDAEELKLDVGLNEFPDVIGNVQQFDVDSNAEAAGKLDLAKIYIEMNDTEGATRLLEEALIYGDEEIKLQAKGLLDKLK